VRRVAPVSLGCLLALTLLGCGRGGDVPGGPAAPTPPAVTDGADGRDVVGQNLVPAGYDGRFRGVGLVLEAPGDGPQLCLGAVEESLPPQCGGPVVAGWDWDAVPEGSYELANDVRWGSYVVVGTYDGEQLTMTEPARPPKPGDVPTYSSPDFTTPCPEPEGGWVPPDPERATDAAFEQTTALAAATEGFGALWVDQPELDMDDESTWNDPQRFVVNVTTTGDLAAMEDRLREVWGGSLCVSPAVRTGAELDRIQAEVGSLEGFAGSGTNGVAGVVEVDVLVATEEQQAELDETYGPGAVVLRGALEPLD
jgi:hypothetical protein